MSGTEDVDLADDQTDPAAVAARLRAQLEKAQRRAAESDEARSQAMREAQQARQQVVQVTQVAHVAQADAVTHALTAGEQRMATLKSSYAAALRDGDYDKVADLQAEMSEMGAQLAGVRAQQQRAEQQRQQALQVPPRQVQQQQNDPVEQFISGRTPRTAAWLREHRDIAFRNGELSKRLQAAHMLAEDEDLKPDTDEYFSFIERNMGLEKNRQQQQSGAPPPKAGGQRTQSAAPPSREASYGGSRQQSTSISADVVRRAEWMGITPQELQRGIDETERGSGFINGNPYGRRA